MMHFEFLRIGLQNSVTIALAALSQSARPIFSYEKWFVRETGSNVFAVSDFYSDGPYSEDKQRSQDNHRADAHNAFHAAALISCLSQ